MLQNRMYYQHSSLGRRSIIPKSMFVVSFEWHSVEKSVSLSGYVCKCDKRNNSIVLIVIPSC